MATEDVPRRTDVDGSGTPRHRAGDDDPARTAGSPRRRWYEYRAVGIPIEVAATILPALLFLFWSKNIDVNPLQRVGQVSAEAAVGFRFAIVAIGLVAAVSAAQRWGPPAFGRLAARIGCGAVAGLATGLVAGGMAVALRGTPWALWAGMADYSPLIKALQSGGVPALPAHYPPLFPVLMDAWSSLSGKPLAYALQDLQLVGTALFGPAAYLAWRLVLRPFWALAIGVVAMLPFIEPIKPYPQITLVMVVPVFVFLLQTLRRSGTLSGGRSVLIGLAFGVGLGLLFLLYSGWYVWCAPGLAVAFAVVVPWRSAWRQALLLAGTALVAFVGVAWVHLRGLFDSAGALTDNYFYFDTCSDPAYIAMWRTDRAFGAGSVWPPLGELGGVGLFTVLLTLGAGVALALAWRRTIVIAIGSVIVSAWVLRMWLAGQMYATETVRLYPRTTMVVLYGLLLLTGLAVFFLVEAVRRFRNQQPSAGGVSPRVPLGVLLIPLLFLFAAAGSATIDKYMPNQRQDSDGYFAWVAQASHLLDGGCSRYAGNQCGVSSLHPLPGTDPVCGPGLPPYTGPIEDSKPGD